MKPIKSLSIFFPFFNDEGTVERQIRIAFQLGEELCGKNFEVIAIHGGRSKDKTRQKIKLMKKRFPSLIYIDKSRNKEGYAVIKHGFAAATKEWIFYTDGDAQYHLEDDLAKFITTQLKTQSDVVNGYKSKRRDPIWRVALGGIYARLARFVFNLPIRDIDCDCRLIRKNMLDKIVLESSDASILPELIKKLDIVGARFTEVPVIHYKRVWGSSNYSALDLIREKLLGDFQLYMDLKKIS